MSLNNPSIYTHSIAWAMHGKAYIRAGNIHNYKLLGNRLDKLFQNANDGCTNGVPIGPVVSDIIGEIIASAADKILSHSIRSQDIDCQIVRWRDDYRILVKTKEDGRKIIKLLQAALKQYSLELGEEKTTVSKLPDGLFRQWVSKYHAIQPRKRKRYTWKEFRELYLAVIRIDRECPGTGVIDRFLADIVSGDGKLKLSYSGLDLQKATSMLIMLATLRVKSFPKVVGIMETILKSDYGRIHQAQIVEYLDEYLQELSNDEERYKYLISWICYFLQSNQLIDKISAKPTLKDPITRSILNNRGDLLFKDCREFKLFVGCISMGRKISMIQHLEVFSPRRADLP